MVTVSLRDNTIPHEVLGEFGGGKVLLKPASPEPASSPAAACARWWKLPVSATSSPRAWVPTIHANVVKATLSALTQMRTREEFLKARGKFKSEKAMA